MIRSVSYGCLQHRHAILVPVLIALLLSACAPRSPLEAERIETGKSIVYGQVEVISREGRGLSWTETGGMFSTADDFHVLLLRGGETEATPYRLTGSGSFAWNLEPGDYTIAGYRWSSTRPRLSRRGRIWARFAVPPDRPAVYIGKLTLAFENGTFVPEVSDAFEADTVRFRDRLAALQRVEPAKNPMVLPAPDRPALAVRSICDPEWAIACTDRFLGVTPDYPKPEGLDFPRVDSLRPTLRWQPSAKAEVRYDVAVYEAVTFSMGGSTEDAIPGRLVGSADGLREPRFTLPEPLASDTRHFWTYRLRENGTVSTWSEYTYEWGTLIIWQTGQRLFRFRTPER